MRPGIIETGVAALELVHAGQQDGQRQPDALPDHRGLDPEDLRRILAAVRGDHKVQEMHGAQAS